MLRYPFRVSMVPFLVLLASLAVLLYSPVSSQAAQLQVAPEEDAPSIGTVPKEAQFTHVHLRPERRPPNTVGPSEGSLDLNFESFGFDDNISYNGGFVFIPPDPMGAAGTNRLVAVVNTMVECRTKGGHLIWRSSLSNFFAPLSPKTFTFDPKVVWDHYANRFVVVSLEAVFAGSNMNPANESRLLVAVSTDASPANEGDWHFYAIDAKTNLPGPGGLRDAWADYPGFEVDEEAVYVTANMFGFSPGFYLGVNLWIIDKGLGTGGFYDGGAGSHTVHNPYAGGGVTTTTMPTLIFGNGGVGGPGSDVGTFLVSYSGLRDGAGIEYVQVVTVSDPLGGSGGPYFAQEFIQIGDIDSPGSLFDAPQADTAYTIEVNDRRALDAAWRDDMLWMTATTKPPSGPETGQTTAYWWKLDTSGGPGATTLADHGPIGGEDIAAGTYTFFPAVAVNSLGEVMFGFSASAPTIYAGAYAAGRQPGDAAGTVQPAITVKEGVDWYYRRFGGPRNRWGDYSGACVDPETDKFWVFNEFADTRGTPTNAGTQDGRWTTVFGRVKFVDGGGAVAEFVKTTGSDVLFQNSPNPFNPSTHIEYVLPRDMQVAIDIYNVQGQHVRTLVSGFANAGKHGVTWDGRDALGRSVASGVYIYRIQGPGISQSKRMVVVK